MRVVCVDSEAHNVGVADQVRMKERLTSERIEKNNNLQY